MKLARQTNSYFCVLFKFYILHVWSKLLQTTVTCSKMADVVSIFYTTDVLFRLVHSIIPENLENTQETRLDSEW